MTASMFLVELGLVLYFLRQVAYYSFAQNSNMGLKYKNGEVC